MTFDHTLFIQAGIFIAIFFILKALYFEPVLAVLKKRDALTIGKASETDSLVAQTEEMRKDYQERLSRIRSELERHREAELASLRALLFEESEGLKKTLEAKAKEHQEFLSSQVAAERTKFSSLTQELRNEIVGVMTDLKLRSI